MIILTSCGNEADYTPKTRVSTPQDRYLNQNRYRCAYSDGSYRPYDHQRGEFCETSSINCDSVNRLVRQQNTTYQVYSATYLPNTVNYISACPYGTAPMYYGYAVVCANVNLVRTCNTLTDQYWCRCVPVTWFGYVWGQGICL
ncbi:MAG: hypothetical protein KDD50_06080 [Bdellovibrionales bacterium]|nr:hypothetical protein [Bdellovibrionales bacterium]